MTALIHITQIESPDLDDLSQRGVNRAMKAAFFAVANCWHEKFLKLHFKGGNFARYNLRPRSKAWLQRKQRLAKAGLVKEGGHVLLVAGGAMREAVLHKHLVKAYPTRSVIDLIGPFYLTLRPKKPNRPNMGEEVTRVIPEEFRELDRVAGQALDEAVKQERSNKRKRTK